MNTVTLSRADWEIIDFVINAYIYNSNIQGGSLDVILDSINSQLDKQEY